MYDYANVFPYPRGQASAMGVINLKNCRVSVSIFDRVVKLRQTFKYQKSLLS